MSFLLFLVEMSVPSQSCVAILNLENKGDYTNSIDFEYVRANFNRDFPKMDIFGISKSILDISFPIIRKLTLVVLSFN